MVLHFFNSLATLVSSPNYVANLFLNPGHNAHPQAGHPGGAMLEPLRNVPLSSEHAQVRPILRLQPKKTEKLLALQVVDKGNYKNEASQASNSAGKKKPVTKRRNTEHEHEAKKQRTAEPYLPVQNPDQRCKLPPNHPTIERPRSDLPPKIPSKKQIIHESDPDMY